MPITNELRDTILQAAIQGRITVQLSTDIAIEEYCDRIAAERTEWRVAHHVKNTKAIKITDDEIPFEIPSQWKWIRFSNIMCDISTGPFGTMLHKTDYIQGQNGVPVINPTNIIKGSIVPSDNMQVSEETAQRLNSYRLTAGMIIMGRRGEMGRCAVVTEKEHEWLCGTGSFFMIPVSSVNKEYIIHLFRTPYVKTYLCGKSIGETMNNLNHTILKKMPVPLPPLEEQQRIVNRVNELLAKVDEFEKIEQQLTALKANFPGDMRSAILQAAMQGKLTEQLETDSSVETLYDTLRNQRNELIKSKKIKNEKIVPVCEFPFDIPNSWVFIRLGEAIKLVSGQDFTPDGYSDVEIKNGIPYLTGASNLNNGEVIINRWTSCGRAIAYRGDLLITCKGTVGAMAFLPVDEAHIARQIMAVSTLGNMNIFYVRYCLENFILSIKAKAKSEIPGIDRKVILNQVIPLPPIEEQQRIVEQLDKLLPLCDELVE